MPDILVAIRSLRKTAGFTTVAVLALGLGIGANTAIFSGVRALLLGPMPYSHPERLVAVWEDASKIGFARNTPAPGNFADWRRMNQVFTDMAAVRFGGANLTGGDRPEFVLGKGVTANFFDVLGSRPIAGRTFTEQEDNAGAGLVVIGYALAQRRFQDARHAVGATLLMNNRPYTVTGVMPPGFAFPDRQYEYWQPAHFSAAEWNNRNSHFLNVVARLKPGVSAGKAQAEMTAIARALERQHPDTNGSLGAVVVPLRDELVGETGTELTVLMIAAAVVLFIACANIANLLLIRGAERRRELAVRAALGASRRQIVAQLTAEAVVLCVAGTALGLLLSAAGMSGLQTLIPATLVNSSTLKTDWVVLGFAIAMALASSLFFGLLPAFRSSRLDLNDALKQGGRTMTEASGRLRRGFVVAQVALALVLLAGAGMLIQTLAGLRSRDLGFAADHLLTMLTPLSSKVYDTDPKILAFSDRVVEQVLRIPGVRGAGFASDLPFTSIGDTNGFQIEGRAPSPEDQFNDALYREVSSGYMAALGAHPVAGRLLDDRDSATAQPAIVINETFAKRYWPDRSALGARIRVGGPKDRFRTIVGVIQDVRERGMQLDLKPAMYLPFRQVQQPGASYLLVRTAVDPESVSTAVQSAIRSVDPQQPVSAVRTMEAYITMEMAGRDGQFRILEIFAGLALFLAALGIYGVLAYAVTQRRREIGIRRAFGADTASVAGLVLRQGLGLTAAGLAGGALLAWITTRAMASLLQGTRPLNVVAMTAAAAILLAAALAACIAPSLAASRVEPASILREE
jgi:putative ABC transport system permease protein